MIQHSVFFSAYHGYKEWLFDLISNSSLCFHTIIKNFKERHFSFSKFKNFSFSNTKTNMVKVSTKRSPPHSEVWCNMLFAYRMDFYLYCNILKQCSNHRRRAGTGPWNIWYQVTQQYWWKMSDNQSLKDFFNSKKNACLCHMLANKATKPSKLLSLISDLINELDKTFLRKHCFTRNQSTAVFTKKERFGTAVLKNRSN